MGIGFCILAISGFPRIPNKPNGRQITGITGFLILFAGIISGYTGYNRHEQIEYRQALYESVYKKYTQNNKLNISTHEIRFAFREKQAQMESRVTLRNSTTVSCPEIILYLNPSLEVTSIQKYDKPIPFVRDAQAIIISDSVSPGDSITLNIYYQGTIDESICYLCIPENQKEFDIDNRHYLSCRFGHRYAFLEENYTLLTPECLWYPVTSPPMDPSCPYNTPCDFTHYVLTVDHPTQLTAISQGSHYKTESGTRFENDHPQRNISLCIGKYRKREINVDGITYELYMSPNNFEILTPIEQQTDSLPEKIRDIKEIIEYERKVTYPFSRLRLVETPITFTSHFHPAMGGSEMAQPEILFLPERGIGILNEKIKPFANSWLRFETFKRSPFKSIILWKFNHEHVMTNWEEGTISHLKLGVTWNYDDTYSIFNFNPLFFNHINHIHSPEYPTINGILNQIVKRSWENRSTTITTAKSHQEALNYLNGKSYREALTDNTLSFDVINQINELKANDLLMQIILRGVTVSDFHQFTQDFMQHDRFQQTNFQTFDNAFLERFGWQLSEIFPMYFDQRELPAFRVKNLRKKGILSPSEKKGDPWTPHSKFRIEFDVLNESDVNGVISIHIETSVFLPKIPGLFVDRTIYTPRSFAVKARETKKIIFIYEGIPHSHSIHTGLSKNRPNMFEIFDEVFRREKKPEYTTDSIAREEPLSPDVFFPPTNDIIVDNEDPGFHIINPPVPWLSRLLGIENKHHHGDILKAVSHWETQISTNCYGGYSLSCVGKTTGKGKASLTWTTHIDKKGKYKIYAYIPNNSYREEVRRTRWNDNPIRDIMYYYTISHESGKKDIKIHAPETSKWVFLGEFMIPEGECSVILYDIGLPGQCVVGDAIKWVYQKP